MAEDTLARYRSMRDFEATPEPSGREAGKAETDGEEQRPRFVIQQHDATRLHWDLRLEHRGVAVSWALPRGLPWSPDENHLAVHTEDHPIEYLEFSGEIPEGSYGAGRMFIWDAGTYEAETFTDDKVVLTLHGERSQGRYALFPTRGRDWMIHRMDPPADPDRQPVPTDLRPMAATPGPLPEDEGDHAYEIRWRGQRVLVTSSGGRVTIVDAGGDDLSERLPDVRRVGRAIGAPEVVLDGVLVAVDRDGRPQPDPAPVGRRLGAGSESAVRRLANDVPVAVVLFDLLWLEGHPANDHPWTERRRLLEALALQGPAWQTPSVHRGAGAAPLLEAAAGAGLPGLVAKRLDSPYRPGTTSPDWIEIATS